MIINLSPLYYLFNKTDLKSSLFLFDFPNFTNILNHLFP